MGFVIYLFAQSALIAHVRHTAVQLSAQQMPDLHERFLACCEKLRIDTPPEAYVLQGHGVLNAFATRFLGRNFVILLSEVVDAMEPLPDGVNFYIGHELGHIRMKHLTGQLWRWPVMWVPLLGAAYARAKETTCDLHGLACCEQPESAARALAVLAAGSKRWQSVELKQYAGQTLAHRGFWASFHELVAGYPWLTKRVARVLKPDVRMPGRNPLAYFFALFVPYGGRLGGAGPLMAVAFVGVLAAVALPAYQAYTHRAKVAAAWTKAEGARDTVARYFASQHRPPQTLDEAGLQGHLADGTPLSLDAESMTLSLQMPDGELLMVPHLDGAHRVRWVCAPGEGVSPQWLPASCKGIPQPAP
jgi:Tfp pilus assembly major pilin PilA